MHEKIPFQELQIAFYYILENVSKSLCIQVGRNKTIMWNSKWGRACLAVPGSQQSLSCPWSHRSSSAQTLNTRFLLRTTWTATKCRFGIVSQWIFRNADFILWCYNPPLDLLCWVADSMSVTRKVVDWSIYKVPYRKNIYLYGSAQFSANFKNTCIVCSFFNVTTIMQQQKFYDSVFCASIYLVENKFYSTFLNTFIYIM